MGCRCAVSSTSGLGLILRRTRCFSCWCWRRWRPGGSSQGSLRLTDKSLASRAGRLTVPISIIPCGAFRSPNSGYGESDRTKNANTVFLPTHDSFLARQFAAGQMAPQPFPERWTGFPAKEPRARGFEQVWRKASTTVMLVSSREKWRRGGWPQTVRAVVGFRRRENNGLLIGPLHGSSGRFPAL
jgi:hypothetical protein